MTVTVHRNAGHPWTGVGDWDLLELEAASMEQLHLMISDAERKHWQVWIRDQARVAAVLYKPSGASAPWEDLPRQGTPRAKCLSIAVGDQVYTDFAGRITAHRVTDRQTERFSQTGCMLRVTPPVPGSGFLAEDPGQAPRKFNNAWLDAAWFRPAL